MARKAKTPVWNIAVRTDSYQSVTRHRDPDNEWDADDIYNNISVKGVEVVNENQHYDFPVSFEPRPDQTYYLVAVTYDTGDSFHREEGVMEFVSMFQNGKDADRVAKEITEHYRRYKNDWKHMTVDVTLPEGKLEFFAPWCGYFERLVCAEVIPVSLSGYQKYEPY